VEQSNALKQKHSGSLHWFTFIKKKYLNTSVFHLWIINYKSNRAHHFKEVRKYKTASSWHLHILLFCVLMYNTVKRRKRHTWGPW